MNGQINEFANRYSALYRDTETTVESVIGGFAEECLALGFEADGGKTFMDLFSDGQPFENADELKRVIGCVSDISLLGSAVFSKWQHITHSDCGESLLSEENRAWFVTAFERMAQLTAEEASSECMLILFPEFVAMKAEIQKLRTEISMLLLERDELQFVECKNIEMQYMLTLGALEYKAFELYCKMLRLKRKIELIQAMKNRQEKVSIAAIEKTLDKEFAEYKEQLDEKVERMNDALERSRRDFLSEDESKELKALYHAAVKALHPDLHPDVTQEQIRLFHNAVAAYENGDLNALRIINAIVADPIQAQPSENGMAALTKEKERLEKTLGLIKLQIAGIKDSYPYNLKPIVQSPELTAEKKAELEDTVSKLEEIVETYKVRIKEMML